jgi:hypothetical protein
MHKSRVAAALSLVGAISLVSVPVQAAPLTSLSAAAKPAAQSNDAIQQVRWGGWHGGGLAFGIGALAAGALIGAAIASPSYYYGGYYPYYGGYPYYRYGYGYGYPSGWGYSTTYYPAYSYRYYRPYRHFAFGFRHYRPHRHFAFGVRHYRAYRHFHVAHRPFWRHSFAMVGVRHHHRHHHRR